jgi:hypothetical protein
LRGVHEGLRVEVVRCGDGWRVGRGLLRGVHEGLRVEVVRCGDEWRVGM